MKQALQENKITGRLSQRLGPSAAGGLGKEECFSHQVSRQNCQLGEESGSCCALSHNTARKLKQPLWGSCFCGEVIAEGEEVEKKKGKLDLKENASCLPQTHSYCVICVPLLGSNLFNYKKPLCPWIPRRICESKYWKAALWLIFSELAAIGRIRAYLFIETVVHVFICVRIILSFLHS